MTFHPPVGVALVRSRWPAIWTGAMVSAVSSRTSRMTASVSVSPASTTPPGKV
jgi:hypothetical protein